MASTMRQDKHFKQGEIRLCSRQRRKNRSATEGSGCWETKWSFVTTPNYYLFFFFLPKAAPQPNATSFVCLQKAHMWTDINIHLSSRVTIALLYCQFKSKMRWGRPLGSNKFNSVKSGDSCFPAKILISVLHTFKGQIWTFPLAVKKMIRASRHWRTDYGVVIIEFCSREPFCVKHSVSFPLRTRRVSWILNAIYERGKKKKFHNTLHWLRGFISCCFFHLKASLIQPPTALKVDAREFHRKFIASPAATTAHPQYWFMPIKCSEVPTRILQPPGNGSKWICQPKKKRKKNPENRPKSQSAKELDLFYTLLGQRLQPGRCEMSRLA